MSAVISDRENDLQHFVASSLADDRVDISVASADASFRSYWRARSKGKSWIVMDDPPTLEDVRPWLDIGARLRAAGLHAPEVIAVDLFNGFVLMEDLGARLYLPELNERSVDRLYGDALDALLRMQERVSTELLPVFDSARTIPEMELLGEWFLRRHLGVDPDCGEWDHIENAMRFIANSADQQPRRFMHRDFHSRNLIVVPRDNPAIIDFQGAMLGPVTYDLASLLRDCYIAWPIERVDAWVERYRQRLVGAGIVDVDAARFRRWFDLIGLQRHIKVLGLFCRLNYRDGKPAYLNDLPLILKYVLDVASRYPQLVDFSKFIKHSVGARDITRARPLGATS